MIIEGTTNPIQFTHSNKFLIRYTDECNVQLTSSTAKCASTDFLTEPLHSLMLVKMAGKRFRCKPTSSCNVKRKLGHYLETRITCKNRAVLSSSVIF